MKAKILLVDDNSLFRNALTHCLKNDLFEVIDTDSAESALTVLNDTAGIDLLIIDQTLPGLSGTEALRRIRRRCPELPAIILSGHLSGDIAADIGADALTRIVQKAGDPCEIFTVIESLLPPGGRPPCPLPVTG